MTRTERWTLLAAILGSGIVLAGALADFYGRRRIFAIGPVRFGFSSLLWTTKLIGLRGATAKDG